MLTSALRRIRKNVGSFRASHSQVARRTGALRLYRRFLQPGDLCFDVGANVGDRTALFLELGARVVAVEPQPICVSALHERFADRITVVPAALGSTPGAAELQVASYHTLSSLSPTWVAQVRKSGRFSEFTWDERISVPITTLDALIERFAGVPKFCKIDVEGYELEVLQGLTKPLPALSFEFTFELLESRLACVDHLAELGMSRFNFSAGESMQLALTRWVDAPEIRSFLKATPKSPAFFGDIYATIESTPRANTWAS